MSHLLTQSAFNSTIAKLKSPSLNIKKEMLSLFNKTEKPLTARTSIPFIGTSCIARKANNIYELTKKEHPNMRLHQRNLSQAPGKSSNGLVNRLNKFMQFEDDEVSDINSDNVYNFEKELFGSYNFPHDFDSAIDVISQAKEWTQNPKKYIEESINGNESTWHKRNTLPNRKQVVLLEKWIKYRKDEISNSDATETAKHQKLTILYFIGFLELTRQNTIICQERGKALANVWSGYFQLQESIRNKAEQESENTTQRLTTLLQTYTSSKQDIVQMKNEKIQELEIDISTLHSKIDRISESNSVLTETLSSKMHELESLQEYTDKIQQSLTIKDSENKSLRMLGGGYTADSYLDKAGADTDDCALDINKLREMMIRKRVTKVTTKKDEENKQIFASKQKKQSIFYDDYDNFQAQKKLTIRELLKSKKAGTVDNTNIDINEDIKHMVQVTQSIFNKEKVSIIRDAYRSICSLCIINII